MDKLEIIERGKLVIAGLLASAILLYFVWGATHNGIYIPGRRANPGFTIQGIYAWVACLAPILFFAAEATKIYSRLHLESSARKSWYWTLMISAILVLILPIAIQWYQDQ